MLKKNKETLNSSKKSKPALKRKSNIKTNKQTHNAKMYKSFSPYINRKLPISSLKTGLSNITLELLYNRLINIGTEKRPTYVRFFDEQLEKILLNNLKSSKVLNPNNLNTPKQLIDKGTLSQLNINCIVLKHDKEECKRVKKYDYQEEMNYIVSHAKRNNFVKRLGETVKGNTLILFQLIHLF